MDQQKKYLKLTDLILRAIEKLRFERFCRIQNKLEIFSYHTADVNKYSNLYYRALARNYINSAVKIKEKISRNLNDFSYQLQQFKDYISQDVVNVPVKRLIYDDLMQIRQEQGRLSFDLDERTISVFTDQITLEDIYLGAFEIKLFIDNIPDMYKNSPYRIIALDPNPAGSNEMVTHPHVSDEYLCEGDGHISIQRAIEQGRLNDFFTIVISILNTYNPDSPYVSLSDWAGYSCYDCGYTTSGEDNYYCEFCCNDFCDQCSTYCQICDQTMCLGCACKCPECDKPVCTHCTAECRDCQSRFCKNCLTEDNLCKDCEQIRKDKEDEDIQTDVEIQSQSMGKTDIHA